MPFLLLLLSLSWVAVQAGPLTAEQIRNARNIVVVTGTFDPWTIEDQKFVDEVKKSWKADLVIALPVETKIGDTPLPMKTRLELIDPSVAVPLGEFEKYTHSPSELMSRLRDLNPRLNVRRLESSLSNFNVRKWMNDHVDDYFKDELHRPPQLSASAYDKIVKDGLYLGRSPVPPTMMDNVLSFVVNKTTAIGLYDRVRAVAVKLTARPNLREFNTGDETVKIVKYLASGLTGDAYIAEVNGEKIVLKVSKNSAGAKHAMNEASLVHAWLRKNTSIIVPELKATGSDGGWQALELVDGDPLDKFIARNGGNIPPETEAKLKELFREAERMNNVSSIKLDISADNIFIRKSDGAAVLVDFGPIRASNIFAADYEVARARWISAGSALVRTPPPTSITGITEGCHVRALDKLLRD